ncbi:MAG: hypothetical protein HUK22_05505, partial [Thermoguttaceae bacterium]|nr:hypothetical protein [Thermoguttaceae bacterium]
MTTEYDEYLEAAVFAAREAGAILAEKLGKIGFREKGPADLVTEADVASQRRVEEILSARFPTHYFLGEESQSSLGGAAAALKNVLREDQCGSKAPADKPYTWIIDPLDGTTNFVHQVPFFCTSIGLARGVDLLCGVIFNPISGELFTATRGGGAYLNGVRLKTSDVIRPQNALTSISFPTLTTFHSPDYLAFQRFVP